MKHVINPLAAAVATAAVFLSAGCVSDFSGSTISQAEARTQMSVSYGTITRIEAVTIEGNDGVVGAVAGGALGGAVGSAFGGGSGNAIATVVGAVVGAAAGASVERTSTTQQAYSFEVTLDDGRIVAVTQTPGSDTFSVGQRVRLLVSRDGTTRIRP